MGIKLVHNSDCLALFYDNMNDKKGQIISAKSCIAGGGYPRKTALLALLGLMQECHLYRVAGNTVYPTWHVSSCSGVVILLTLLCPWRDPNCPRNTWFFELTTLTTVDGPYVAKFF